MRTVCQELEFVAVAVAIWVPAFLLGAALFGSTTLVFTGVTTAVWVGLFVADLRLRTGPGRSHVRLANSKRLNKTGHYYQLVNGRGVVMVLRVDVDLVGWLLGEVVVWSPQFLWIKRVRSHHLCDVTDGYGPLRGVA